MATTTKTAPKAISFALPPVNTKCTECQQPALRLITYGGKSAEAMCLDDAARIVKSGNGRYVQVGETYKMTSRTPAGATAVPNSNPTAVATVDGPQPSAVHQNSRTADETLDVEAAPEAGEGELSKVTRLAERQLEIQKEIDALQKQLALKQAELKVNQETDLPEALDAAGVKKFTLRSGQEIEMKDVVAAGITKANQDPGFAYLERVGWGTLISRVFQIKFDRKDIKLINKFQRDLKQRKIPLKVEIKMSVNSRSLAKSIRENDALPADDEDRIDLAQTVPGMQLTAEKLLGVWRVRKAIVGTDDAGDAGGDDAAIG